MSTSSSGALSQTVARGLAEKLYDKRKTAALQIETRIRELVKSGDHTQIDRIIADLDGRFVENPQPNTRKGGVLGLAAVAIGLGPPNIERHLAGLIKPTIRAMQDRDARVRYYALEATYNVAKVARRGVLPLFNELFDGMCKLSSDLEQSVKSGVLLLDRLVKDIVTETEGFDVQRLVPLLERRITSQNPFVRQFLLNWIAVLDSVPTIRMLDHLPAILDGLFVMLADPNADIRRLTDGVLSEFLRGIEDSHSVDIQAMIGIVVQQCASPFEFTQVTALIWVSTFVIRGQELIVPYVARLLAAVLPGLASDVEEIVVAAVEVNQHLVSLMGATSVPPEYAAIVECLLRQLDSPWVATRSSALQWLLMLHLKSPAALAPQMDTLIGALLRLVLDKSVRVVRLTLEVIAEISKAQRDYFQTTFARLASVIRAHPAMLEDRAALVIRQLATHLPPVDMYTELARLMIAETDLAFARRMVESLNVILLTAPELADVRDRLRALDASSADDCALFEVVYKAWCHDAVATFSLCILCQAYDHALALVKRFGELDITVDFLVAVDKFVQLLESPIFTHLRLQLLEPAKYGSLYKCLYGLLMLLPQSTAFRALHSRLTSITALGSVSAASSSSQPPTPNGGAPATPRRLDSLFGSAELLAFYDAVQRTHTDNSRRSRARERREDAMTRLDGGDDDKRVMRSIFAPSAASSAPASSAVGQTPSASPAAAANPSGE